MRAVDVDPTIRDWIYASEMLRRLGFSADEIFFAVAPDGNVASPDQPVPVRSGLPVVVLELRAQGKTFRWTIGQTAVALADLEAAHRDACAIWNGGTDADALHAGFAASHPMQQKVGLLVALRAKGLVLPYTEHDL